MEARQCSKRAACFILTLTLGGETEERGGRDLPKVIDKNQELNPGCLAPRVRLLP